MVILMISRQSKYNIDMCTKVNKCIRYLYYYEKKGLYKYKSLDVN